jgi:hypothetical protein
MSIGAPLGVNITGDSAGAEQALDRVGKKLDQVEQKARRATLATRDLNNEVAKNLQAGAGALRGNAASGGLAAAGAGIKTGGVIGAIATGVAAGGIVYQVLDRFAKLSEENAKQTLEASRILADAAKEAKQAREASALRGFNQEDAYRATKAATGGAGIDQAKEMMAAGYSTQEAYGVSQQAVLSERQRAIIDTVRRRGGNVVDATRKMLTNPEAYSISDAAWAAGTKNYINPRSDAIASVVNLLTGGNGDSYTDSRMLEDEFLKRAAQNRQATGAQSLADLTNATSGAGDSAVQQRFMEAASPEHTAAARAEAKLDAQLRALEDMARSQGTLSKVMADVFSPGGSFETQLARAIQNQNKARYGDQ